MGGGYPLPNHLIWLDDKLISWESWDWGGQKALIISYYYYHYYHHYYYYHHHCHHYHHYCYKRTGLPDALGEGPFGGSPDSVSLR